MGVVSKIENSGRFGQFDEELKIERGPNHTKPNKNLKARILQNDIQAHLLVTLMIYVVMVVPAVHLWLQDGPTSASRIPFRFSLGESTEDTAVSFFGPSLSPPKLGSLNSHKIQKKKTRKYLRGKSSRGEAQ